MCKACSHNRLGPILGQCVCPEGSNDRSDVGIGLCESCEISAPRIILGNDLKTLTIDLSEEIDSSIFLNPFNKNSENCKVLFDSETLNKFGKSSPKCEVNRQILNQIIVYLTEFASIQVSE